MSTRKLAERFRSSWPPAVDVALSLVESSQQRTDVTPILQELGRLVGRTTQLDGSETGELSLTPPSLRELEQLLLTGIRCLEELERLVAGDQDIGDEVLRFEADGAAEGMSITVPAAPSLGDVCHVGRLDLERAAKRLQGAVSSEDAVEAREASSRKLLRVVRAVVDAAGEQSITCGDVGELLRQSEGNELSMALALRRRYAEFRRSVPEVRDADPEGVLTAVRYAAGAVATLISCSEFGYARAADRALLRRLQQRVLAWAHSGRSRARGVELLDDLRVCANLLAGISRRQELRVHDGMLISRLCGEPTVEMTAWFAQLQALFGLDDQLDALIARSLEHPTPALVEEIRVRLVGLR